MPVFAVEPHPDIKDLWRGEPPVYLFEGVKGPSRPSLFDARFIKELQQRVWKVLDETPEAECNFLLCGSLPALSSLLLILGADLVESEHPRPFTLFIWDKKGQVFKKLPLLPVAD